MNKKEFTKKLKEALSQLHLPYYDPKKVKVFCFVVGDWAEASLDFCLPYCSIKNLVLFCELNHVGFGFDKRTEISFLNPEDLTEFKIPERFE